MEHGVTHKAHEAVQPIWMEHAYVGTGRLVRSGDPLMLAGGQLRAKDTIDRSEVDLDGLTLRLRVGDAGREAGQQLHAREHGWIEIAHIDQGT
jgi:hypothetical protein